MTATDWAISQVTAQGFTALIPATGGHHELDFQITDPTYWLVLDRHAPVP